MRIASLGLVSIIIGIALTLSAFAGASSQVYPEFAEFYWLGAAGIALVISGLLFLGHCSGMFH